MVHLMAQVILYMKLLFSIYTEQVLETVPLYQYWNGGDHFYSTDYYPGGVSGYRFEGPLGYVYTKPHPEAIPLYRYFNGVDHFYTTILGYYEGYKFESVECYVLPLE